jgi:hypothetical protein
MLFMSIVGASNSRAANVSRACYGIIALVVSAAFVIQLVVLFTGGADANSGSNESAASNATKLIHFFSYFTIQSNLFVLATTIALLLRPDRDGRLWRVARLDALLGIVITGLVYDLVLAREIHLTGAALVATIGFHYISPWATLLTWVISGPRPRISWRTVAAAFIWPVLWIGYTFAHGAMTGWYPYPFLDAAEKGYAAAVAGTAVVFVIACVLAVAFRLADRLPAVRYGRSPGEGAGVPEVSAGSATGPR